MHCAIVLFTCDLRVHDNRALAAAAAERDEVVPAFVLEERLSSRHCASPNQLARAVHEPWRLRAGERRRLRYPPPIVDPDRWRRR